jgi:hypothetical protein
MPNKDWEELMEVDRIMRGLKPVDMSDGVKLTVQLINGFEKFNTKPYHNYENFSDGYRISDGKIAVEAEDLDDALRLFGEKTKEGVK